jgi:hypothetical protein
MTGHDDVTHQRLRREQGSASLQRCVSCPRQAYEWAYQHTGRPEDLDSYSPMCRSCHRKLDHQKSEVLQETWAKSRHDLTLEDHRAGGVASPHPGGPLTQEQAAAMGRAGGNARSRRMKEDPEMRQKMINVAQANRPRGQRKCAECDLVSTVPGLGNHQKHSGHSGWEEVRP